MVMRRNLEAALGCLCALVVMIGYDLSLHLEDTIWMSVSVPWQAPHTASGGLQVVGYTLWWSMYWGLAFGLAGAGCLLVLLALTDL